MFRQVYTAISSGLKFEKSMAGNTKEVMFTSLAVTPASMEVKPASLAACRYDCRVNVASNICFRSSMDLVCSIRLENNSLSSFRPAFR